MKPSVITLIVILAVGIAAIMNTYSSATPSATFELAEANAGETYHITGFLVKDKPFEYNPIKDPNYFAFYLKDKAGTVRKVVSHEPKQQDFERAESVSMYGIAKEDHFLATKVTPKCPSKYEDEQNNKTGKAPSTANL
ncbi:MAG: cytochrome c-type biogenesis protein CcmE [Pseudoalteromonas distincta]|jgi:cytochrome c-type biogenesis protein CcmE